MNWRKSSYSMSSSSCVELAAANDVVVMRDSKRPEAGHLTFRPEQLVAFVRATSSGALDGLA